MKRLILLFALLLPLGLSAQNTWAVKTNVLHDVSTLSLNLAGEYAFKPQWSAELGTSVNFWGSWGGSRLDHVLLEPEVKYWFCEKFSGWFVDAHGIGGYANVGNFWDFTSARVSRTFAIISSGMHLCWALALAEDMTLSSTATGTWNSKPAWGISTPSGTSMTEPLFF
ncbi:MAG: DUF3575 domain-containing protein [Bacteroidales bacterium]|nr:DUF3575 domain-containing protein [Bacteroidales bacterium]